jgi:type I restriction enzyme R subunit
VCDSRRAAADCKRIIDRLIQQQYGGEIKTLVAFSGEVEDSHGRKCTEANMNDEQAADNDIRELFKKPDYKILIVAEKFQTGFDQPLLHTMYVDKMLGGIQCIQTLSRLNRCCPGKEDTHDHRLSQRQGRCTKGPSRSIYTETELVGEPDTQRVYSMMNEVKMLDGKEMVSGEEVNEVVAKLLKKETAVAVPSIFKRIVEDRVKPLSEANRDKYRKLVGRYVRQYGFNRPAHGLHRPRTGKILRFLQILLQVSSLYQGDIACRDTGTHPDLDKLRIQAGYEGQLKLEDEGAVLPGTRIGDVNTKRPDDEKTVKEIIGEVNEPYKGFLDENDKILKQIWDELLADPEIDQAFNAENSFDMLMKLVKDKFDEKVANEIEKYYNFAEVLEKEKGFSIALISRFVDALTRRAAQNHRLTYDEEALKEKMADMMNDEFLDLYDFPKIEKVVDGLFFVLNTQSLDKLDGIDDILKDTFNKVFMGKDMHSVERRLNFNTLVSSFEQFLKKLYYLIYGEEVEPHRPDRPNGTDAYATLSNAIYALRFLRNLHHENSVALIKFAHYLEQVKQWRNVQAHDSPVVADDDIATNTRIVVAMYLYSAGKSLKSLQSSGD